MLEQFFKNTKRTDEAPFKEILEPSGLSHKINQLKNRPDKLVRQIKLIDRHHGAYTSKEALEKEINHFKRGFAVFRNLEHRYGIAVPEMDLLVGKDNDENIAMFTVIDKIIGEDLWDIKNLPPSAKDEFERFLSAVARHYFDTYQEGGDYWWDFYEAQIVYGHKFGEKNDKVYVVDTDPTFETYRKTRQTKYAFGLFNGFKRIINCIKTAEKKFSQPTKLQNTRNILSEIFAKIPKTDANYSIIRDLQLKLE